MPTIQQILARVQTDHIRVLITGERLAALEPAQRATSAAWMISASVSDRSYQTVRRWCGGVPGGHLHDAVDIDGVITPFGQMLLDAIRRHPTHRCSAAALEGGS